MLNWSSGPGRELHIEQPLASFVLFCLRQVHWESRMYEDNSWTYILTDLIALPQWYPTDSTREPECVKYLGSLSFLCVLLVQFLRESHAQVSFAARKPLFMQLCIPLRNKIFPLHFLMWIDYPLVCRSPVLVSLTDKTIAAKFARNHTEHVWCFSDRWALLYPYYFKFGHPAVSSSYCANATD